MLVFFHVFLRTFLNKFLQKYCQNFVQEFLFGIPPKFLLKVLKIFFKEFFQGFSRNSCKRFFKKCNLRRIFFRRFGDYFRHFYNDFPHNFRNFCRNYWWNFSRGSFLSTLFIHSDLYSEIPSEFSIVSRQFLNILQILFYYPTN